MVSGADQVIPPSGESRYSSALLSATGRTRLSQPRESWRIWQQYGPLSNPGAVKGEQRHWPLSWSSFEIVQLVKSFTSSLSIPPPVSGIVPGHGWPCHQSASRLRATGTCFSVAGCELCSSTPIDDACQYDRPSPLRNAGSSPWPPPEIMSSWG